MDFQKLAIATILIAIAFAFATYQGPLAGLILGILAGVAIGAMFRRKRN